MNTGDDIKDVRDGLNHKERAVLLCLYQSRKELGRDSVSTALLYGRVLEFVDMSEEEFLEVLGRVVTQ